MTFYHGTSEKHWKQIQDEGVLHGRRFILDSVTMEPVEEVPSRCTYLAVDVDEAKRYGDVILEVEYDPFLNKKRNNYTDYCWQVRVYEPIPIENIKRIS